MAYLSTIKDTSTNEILSYNVSNSLELDIVMTNLGQSMLRRGNCWIDDYINYYNHHPCQWNLKKLTSVKYRNQLLAA